MENLKRLWKILSIFTLAIALIGAISTEDVVFVIAAVVSLPYFGSRLKEEFRPWNSKVDD